MQRSAGAARRTTVRRFLTSSARVQELHGAGRFPLGRRRALLCQRS